MKFDLAERWRTARDTAQQKAEGNNKLLKHGSVASRVGAVQQRALDSQTFDAILNIVNNAFVNRVYGPSKALQNVSIVLKQHEIVNSILMRNFKRQTADLRKVPASKNVFLPCGEPAKYLMHRDVWLLQKNELEEKERKAGEKEARKMARAPRRASILTPTPKASSNERAEVTRSHRHDWDILSRVARMITCPRLERRC